jgi:arylformamidase
VELTMKTHTPAWYNEQYNNRARVPDALLHLQRWALWSAEAMADLSGQIDVPYGPTAGQRLDVFSAPKSRAPIVVFIHGGYWRSLDKSDHTFVVPELIHAGALPVVLNYDLAPQVRVSEICLQILRALAWVWRQAPTLGGDRNRIHVVGHSAGGHLAAMALCAQWPQFDRGLPVDLVKSALSISGVHELDSVRQAGFVQADLKLTASEAIQCSPAWMPGPPQGQIHCLAGALESPEFLRQNELLRQAWGSSTVPTVKALADEDHFSILNQFRDSQSEVMQSVRRMLEG